MSIKREALDYALEYLRLSDASSWTPTDFFEKVVPQFEDYLEGEPSSHGFKPNRVFYLNTVGMSVSEQEKYLTEFLEEVVVKSADEEKYNNWAFGTHGETRIEII